MCVCFGQKMKKNRKKAAVKRPDFYMDTLDDEYVFPAGSQPGPRPRTQREQPPAVHRGDRVHAGDKKVKAVRCKYQRDTHSVTMGRARAPTRSRTVIVSERHRRLHRRRWRHRLRFVGNIVRQPRGVQCTRRAGRRPSPRALPGWPLQLLLARQPTDCRAVPHRLSDRRRRALVTALDG